MSQAQERRELLSRFFAAVESQDVDALRQLCAPDVQVDATGAPPMDFDRFVGFGAGFMSAFPDGHHDIHELLADGERTAYRLTFSGTHTADFMGIPATGKHIAIEAINVDRIVNGKVAEKRVSLDSLGMLQQLGVAPTQPGVELPKPRDRAANGATSVTTADSKEKVRRFFEDALNNRDWALVDELMADDYVNYNMPAPAPGREGMKQVLRMFFSAFPDMRVTLYDVFGEGDLAGSRGAFTGTHTGEFMGVPASGRPVNVDYIDIWRVENGKLAENWVQLDTIGLMQQIGAIPTPEAVNA